MTNKRSCIQCDNLFPIPEGTNKNKKKFCSVECRRGFNYLKTRKEKLQKIKQDRLDNPEKRKKYRDRSKEKINTTGRKWFKENYETKLKPARKRRLEVLPKEEVERQAEVRRKRKAEWWQDNKPELKEKRKLWLENNPDYYRSPEYKVRRSELHKHKMQNNVQYVISQRLRGRLCAAFKRMIGGVKANKRNKSFDLIGCTGEEFSAHFKSKFTKGMSWKKFLAGEIHIDHIKPCAFFDLAKESEQRKCFHYSNLQPLWAKDNLAKGAKYQ